jgi:CBS domain-containing protein
MSKLAKDVMTPEPQCCSPETTLNEVANLMVEADCGEIPVVDASNRLIGVVVMEEKKIRRVPVVDANGSCCGIIAQADVAMVARESEVGEMVREVSRDSMNPGIDGRA